MKKIFLLLFITISAFGQSVTISPTNTQSLLHIKKGVSGVGVFNSDANLHVESNVNNYISLLTPNAFESGVLFGNPTSTAHGGIIYNAGNAKGLQFRTNNNVTRMTLDAIGNLGIGTSTPQYKLDITQRARIRSSTSTAGIWFSKSTNNNEEGSFFGNINDTQAGIWIGNTWRFGVNETGVVNVPNLAGVGTRNLAADAGGNIIALPTQNTNTVAFSLKNTSSISDENYFYPDATIHHELVFNTISYNLGNSASLNYMNHGNFVAPSTGVYHFTFNLFWQGNAVGTRSFALRDLSGFILSAWTQTPPNANPFSQNISCDLFLNANDYIRFFAGHTSDVPLSCNLSSLYSPGLVSGFKVN